MKRLEDQPLLVRRDADAGIAHLDPNRQALAGASIQLQGDTALLGELEGVGEQVAQDLVDLVGIADEAAADLVVDGKGQPALGRRVLEQIPATVRQRGAIDVGPADFHAPRFHFGQVEDIVDQAQQILARAVDDLRLPDLFDAQMPLVVAGHHLGQQDDRVERRAQLVGHVGQKLRFVLAGKLELARPGVEFLAGLAQLQVVLLEQLLLLLHLGVGLLQLLALLLQLLLLLLQLGVGLAQLLGLLLQLLLLFLHAGVGFLQARAPLPGLFLRGLGHDQQLADLLLLLGRVQEGGDHLGRAEQKFQLQRVESLEPGQLHHAQQGAFPQQRIGVGVVGDGVDGAGDNGRGIRRDGGQDDGFLLAGHLADGAFADLEAVAQVCALDVHVAAQQIQGRLVRPIDVEHAAAGREVAPENADRGVGLLLQGKPAGQLRRQPVVAVLDPVAGFVFRFGRPQHQVHAVDRLAELVALGKQRDFLGKIAPADGFGPDRQPREGPDHGVDRRRHAVLVPLLDLELRRQVALGQPSHHRPNRRRLAAQGADDAAGNQKSDRDACHQPDARQHRHPEARRGIRPLAFLDTLPGQLTLQVHEFGEQTLDLLASGNRLVEQDWLRLPGVVDQPQLDHLVVGGPYRVPGFLYSGEQRLILFGEGKLAQLLPCGIEIATRLVDTGLDILRDIQVIHDHQRAHVPGHLILRLG